MCLRHAKFITHTSNSSNANGSAKASKDLSEAGHMKMLSQKHSSGKASKNISSFRYLRRNRISGISAPTPRDTEKFSDGTIVVSVVAFHASDNKHKISVSPTSKVPCTTIAEAVQVTNVIREVHGGIRSGGKGGQQLAYV